MTTRLVVGITGHPGSGKTTAARHIEASYGLSYYCPGDSIRAHAQKLGLQIANRAAAIALLREMDATCGPDVLVRPVLQSQSGMVVDGLRRMIDLYALRIAPAADFRLIAIHADIADRHGRVVQSMAQRGGRDSEDFETFRVAELAEAHNPNPLYPSTEEVMDNADYHIQNTGNPKSLLQAIDQTMQSIYSQ